MRPGALARRGLGYDRLREVNPKIVFCTHSGYGMTGPYKDMPSHGIAYDAWAGVARPTFNDEGLPTLPSYTAIGINAGPLYAALGICAAIIRARATGQGCWFEVAQSDAAAAFNWNGIEGNKAYERPEDEVTGNDGDGKGPRRPVGDDSMKESVRYQYYRSQRRPRPVHGLRARVLEELLRGHRPAGALRRPTRARSTPTTRAATSRSGASWRRSSPRARPPSGSRSASR